MTGSWCLLVHLQSWYKCWCCLSYIVELISDLGCRFEAGSCFLIYERAFGLQSLGRWQSCLYFAYFHRCFLSLICWCWRHLTSFDSQSSFGYQRFTNYLNLIESMVIATYLKHYWQYQLKSFNWIWSDCSIWAYFICSSWLCSTVASNQSLPFDLSFKE